jgi:RNA polymerase sigma-70 factor (ECF subfamily)
MNALRTRNGNPLRNFQRLLQSTLGDDILNVKDVEFISASPTRGHAYLMTDFNEQRALDGLRALDSQSIGAIYDRYFPEIYRYVRYRISDDTIAEDIASDVFVRLMEASQRNKGPQTNLRGWLIATASNAVNDHHRRHYRRPVEALSDSLPDAGASVLSQIDSREQNRIVQQALAQLTDEQQHVLALRFGQGYSIEETAAFMNKNANAIKALQFRALASLQRQIGEVSYE